MTISSSGNSFSNVYLNNEGGVFKITSSLPSATTSFHSFTESDSVYTNIYAFKGAILLCNFCKIVELKYSGSVAQPHVSSVKT